MIVPSPRSHPPARQFFFFLIKKRKEKKKAARYPRRNKKKTSRFNLSHQCEIIVRRLIDERDDPFDRERLKKKKRKER